MEHGTSEKLIDIGDRRELFWDDYLIDTTDAALVQHKPEMKNVSMIHDEAWEGSGCIYHSVFKDGNVIRMYYTSSDPISKDGTKSNSINKDGTMIKHVKSDKQPAVIAYAESYDDGRTFVKPDLGICEFQGSIENNIILAGPVGLIDNFSVFKDPNPDCSPDERYKAVMDDRSDKNSKCLYYYKSEDAIHFTPVAPIMREGVFDSLNLAFWDRTRKQYFLYFRGYHNIGSNDLSTEGEDGSKLVRDIRFSVSKDFKTWSKPKMINFNDDQEVAYYTNVIQPYYRAPHMFIGFPTRYVEREYINGDKPSWANNNFDYLPDPVHRKNRMMLKARLGTTLTDCTIITSRDGENFRRWNEAFISPGIERKHNWVYGDCYPAWGMFETSSDLEYAPKEISIYVPENHFKKETVLRRYTIRKDGFISYNAPFKTKTIITKPFMFKGNKLTINFSTSAMGWVKITILDKDKKPIDTYESVELFGDNLERPVLFKKKTSDPSTDVSPLSGTLVRMKIEMSDTDIYSFKFTNNNN